MGTAIEKISIAEAVADHYPDRSLTIWKDLAEKQIALTKPRAYETGRRLPEEGPHSF